MDHLERLLRHMVWADGETSAALERAADAAPAGAIELYAHVVAAEAVWLARLSGEERPVAVWPALSVAESMALARRTHAGFDRLLAGTSAAELQRAVGYSNSAGHAFESRLEDILLHVFLHGAYHRGQVARLLREAGLEPAPTDYIAFTRGAPAATRDHRP